MRPDLRALWKDVVANDNAVFDRVSSRMGSPAQCRGKEQSPNSDYGAWLRRLESLMCEKNRAVIATRSRTMSESAESLANELENSITILESTLRTYCEATDKLHVRLRDARMAITPERVEIVKSLHDLVDLVGSLDGTLGKLERLADVAERLKVAAGDGWLDKVLLAILEKK